MLLRHWSGNVPQLLPLLEANGILTETLPVATTLDEVCKAGLDALASLRSGKAADSGWTQAKLALLTEAAKPKAEMLIQIVPGVKQLVEAAGR